MILIDNEGKEWEIKPSDCPKPRWLWRDVVIGVSVAFLIASQLFV